MSNNEWFITRLAYLSGLKAPNDQQKLMLELAKKVSLTDDEQRKMKALIRAEKAAERALKARADVAKIVNAEKALKRKARDHALYQAAGLMIVGKLVDTKTGEPFMQPDELLGALLEVAQAAQSPDKRAAWKAKGAEAFKQSNLI